MLDALDEHEIGDSYVNHEIDINEKRAILDICRRCTVRKPGKWGAIPGYCGHCTNVLQKFLRQGKIKQLP